MPSRERENWSFICLIPLKKFPIKYFKLIKMISFAFLTLFIRSELSNINSSINQRASFLEEPKYRITRVFPTQFPTSGKVVAELTITPSYEGSCFCRFADIVVPAQSEKDGTVVCESPKYSTGDAFLFFSDDGESWSPGYPITFRMQTKAIIIIIVIIGGTALATLLMFWWQMRQCAHQSRRNKENLNSYNKMQYDDEDFQPLRRKTNNVL